MLPAALLLIFFIWLGLHFHVNQRVVASLALIFGIATGVFAWGVALIGLVPIAGPLIVKALAIPIIWLINGIGYVVSYVAIRRGYSKDVLTYRSLTIALIVGIIIGFVIGSLV